MSTSSTPDRRPEPRRLPVVEMRSSIRNDGVRNTVHPADVHGRFTRARKAAFVALLAIYLGLPWVRVAGHPAVQIDLPRRWLYLFGGVFNAQDFWLMFFLLTGLGFGLVVLTTILGRVWCGWACPQTVFLEGLFRPIQRLIEGPREARMRRAAAPLTVATAARRAAVWGAYAAVSLGIAHVFLSYFVGAANEWAMIRSGPSAHPEAFAWTAAWTAIILFNFGWFREQLCVVICPYGRFQSALLDPDSVIIGYDAARGEPRGKAREKSHGAGDCVDCNRCVVVCPTGIDIRFGVQMDCVACAACIDACDEVMDKLHRPRGLVRYDSLNGLSGARRRVIRPRLGLYAVLGALGLAAATTAFRHHGDFEANLLRLAGPPYTLDGGVVRNAFDVHLVNKHNARVTYAVDPVPVPGVDYTVPLRTITLDAMGNVHAPVFAAMPIERFQGDFQVHIRVHPVGASGARDGVVVVAPFLGPAR